MDFLNKPRLTGKPIFTALAASLLLTSAHASSCITAGRMNDKGWAPQFQSVRLLDAAGRSLQTKTASDLQNVREVELTEQALLSACDGDRPLSRGLDSPAKGPVPAVKPGRYKVEGIGFPKLQTGGVLVELNVVAAENQIILITR